MRISKVACCCGILVDECLGECKPVRESRLRALSGILTFLSSEREEPEDEGDRSETVGLVARPVDNRRAPFLKSVGRSKEFECVRKKVATLCGILRRISRVRGENASIQSDDDLLFFTNSHKL
jgi:hypothetical protein